MVETKLLRKICKKCLKEKSIDNYNRTKQYKDGYFSCCKQCNYDKWMKKLKTHPGPKKEGQKLCYQCKIKKNMSEFSINLRHKDGLLNICKSCLKDYKKRNKNREDNCRLKRQYGINIDIYNKMSEIQEKKCYICKLKRKLFVDHNHENNKVRKLLCKECNWVLGTVKEDPNVLLSMINYIKEHNGESD